MLTDEDIKKLMAVLVTKDDLEKALEDLPTREDFRLLTTSIDNILKKMTSLQTEFLSLTNKVNRLEEWIKMVAEKTGVKLSV